MNHSCEHKANRALVAFCNNVDDKVEETPDTILVASCWTIASISVSIVADDDDGHKVDNGEKEGKDAHLHIVAVVQNFKFSRE